MHLLLKQFCLLILFVVSAYTHTATALECQVGTPLDHTFSSGAQWRFCAVLDDDHGLELQELHYQAPGDTSRKVMEHVHLGQVLVQSHEQLNASALIGDNKLGGPSLRAIAAQDCENSIELVNQQNNKLCASTHPIVLMAKYSKRPGLHGGLYEIYALSQYQGLTFKVMFGLTEDGRIKPSVTLSGSHTQTSENILFGNALINPIDNQNTIITTLSILYSWRMVFSLNDDQSNDIVEEFNFTLQPSLGSRRPMEVAELPTETFRNIDRESFRGWRVRDPDGRGYYLDPQNSGYSYRDRKNNWAQFDLAVSAFKPCEQHSYKRTTQTTTNTDTCRASLDQIVNGESMSESKPTLWYSLYSIHRPNADDFPIISSMTSEFEIIPFDWTLTSPFEVLGE